MCFCHIFFLLVLPCILNSFSFLSPHLVMLLVEHQPVLDRATSLFRPFVISKFPRLLTLNGQHVSSGDRNISDQFFGSFSRFRFEHPSAWDNDVREIPPPFQSKGSDFSRSQDPSHYSEMTSNCAYLLMKMFRFIVHVFCCPCLYSIMVFVFRLWFGILYTCSS